MRQTLRAMHTPEAEGYGREHALLGEEHGSLERAFAILREYVGTEGESTYCHNDFGASNIFTTKPLTVFDPNPRFNNGYLDLGKCIFNVIANGGSDPNLQQLIEGYFSGADYNKAALHAFVFINTCIKLPYKHKTNKVDIIQSIQGYLAQNKHYL